MASRLTCAIALLLAAASTDAACVIDVNAEITNPFETGCGDVILTYTENDDAGQRVALGFPVPTPVASLTPVDGFRDYASLFARHQSLLTLHDEVSGQVVGQTVAGRDIWAYAVGDTNATTAEGFAEAAALINGGIHAREWQTPEAVTALFEVLAERKANHGLEQYLVENFNTVLVPVNNVDGFLQTQLYPDRTTAAREQPREGRMRRKNLRSPVTQGAIDSDITTVGDNFWGIDPNRNFASGFAQSGRSSASTTSLIHRGAAANSEPEVLALQNATTLAPAARLRFFSDTHSFSQVHFAPTTGNARRNAITSTLSARMRAASERAYAYSPDPAGSPGIGSAADHFAFTYQIPSWTFELEPRDGGQEYGGLTSHGHSGFILPDREVARMRTDVTRMYLLGLYRQSGPPAAIAAQIRDAQSGEVVYDAVRQRTSETARAQTVSVNRALVPGHSYRLWVAFNKPMRIRDGSGAVVAYRGQTQGAAIGTVTLEIPELSGQDVSLGNGTWLSASGGAPNGYLHYTDDAFAVDFTVPTATSVTQARAAVLSLGSADLSDMTLDANAATAADWSDGHWVRYENALNADDDIGGPDCGFKLFVAADAGAVAPATPANCRASGAVVSPAPATSRGGGGGGGSWSVTMLLLLTPLIVLRSRRSGSRMSPPRA